MEVGVQWQASNTKMHSASGSLFNSVFSSSFYKAVSHSECPIGELSEACLFFASVLHEFLGRGVGRSRQKDVYAWVPGIRRYETDNDKNA